MDCPICQIKMFTGEKPIGVQTIQKILFCSKCQLEIFQEKESECIEIENEYYLKINFASTEVNAKNIVSIRKLDRSMSIAEIKSKIAKQQSIDLGIFNRRQIDRIYKQAIALKLDAVIIAI